MKLIILSLITCLSLVTFVQSANAQDNKAKRPSPPAEAKGMIDSANIAVYYSSPAVKGRQIWGALVPNGKIWRTGANEATVFETDRTITIQGQSLPPGKYALFTIPGESEWTFVLNSEWDQWGAFKYDKTKDVLRFTAVPQNSPVFNERLRFDIIDHQVNLFWENTQIGFMVGE